MVSIVTPAFDEAANLPLLYERLSAVLQEARLEWEWVIVDDHSRDATFAVVSALAARDPRVRGLRFARNFGAHAALACGLHQARGACVVALAADLQDPPEVIPELLARWRDGSQVVWAVRRSRVGETAATVGFARLYYWMMRTVVGMKDMPATGADFFLVDRIVVDAFARFAERNTSILALLTWMGFRQTAVAYDKQARAHGRSGWTLAKKLTLVVDSVTAFSAAPIRFVSYLGLGVAALGLLAAVAGWSAVIVVVLLLGGVQMVTMGMLGEYLWRALDESRGRPQYLVEAATPPKAPTPPTAPAPPGHPDC